MMYLTSPFFLRTPQQARHVIKRVADFPPQLLPQLPQIWAVPQDVFQCFPVAADASVTVLEAECLSKRRQPAMSRS